MLHLENRGIQYFHALCFAGRGAKYDTLTGSTGDSESMERAGQIPADLQSMKADAGNDPWHTFPLRDVGNQYQVEQRGGDLGAWWNAICTYRRPRRAYSKKKGKAKPEVAKYPCVYWRSSRR